MNRTVFLLPMPRTQRLAAVLSTGLTLGACNQYNASDQLEQESRDRKSFRTMWEASAARAQELTRAFASGPAGQCQNLNGALGAIDVTQNMLTDAYKYYYNSVVLGFYSDTARWSLDLADAAVKQQCPEQAREIYRGVIADYTGSGYAAYRQRAEIGLDDLRGK